MTGSVSLRKGLGERGEGEGWGKECIAEGRERGKECIAEGREQGEAFQATSRTMDVLDHG